ncbi:MAG TPA: hypothetical protein VNZ55_07175 [Thermomicrobiales bacterium]|nr:hypothetical protein [Thermomicrobiales bacterium]
MCLGILLVLITDLTPVLAAQMAGEAGIEHDLSPEEELAERYAPVAYLKRQRYACDDSGEAYLPLPVDAVLDDPSVLLRLHKPDNSNPGLDPIIKPGPTIDDLAWLSSNYYLDFPGNALNPGCWYEHWSRSKAGEYEPTVYAHIATQDDVEGLALQYWFFWIFNDFNNRHEGDWEMIQLNFEASTVEDALGEDPVTVTYAQHGGGERSDWMDDEVQREGSHPIVFPAAGSHASYYDARTWLGWGPGGTGFGCDITTRPYRREQLQVVLIPENPDPSGDFAWLYFRGRWGELRGWEYNGPRTPSYTRKWREPVTWVDTVRDRSLFVPESFSLGPTPDGFFCTVTEQAAKGLMFFTLHPWRMVAVLVALFASVVYLFALLRRSLARAAWLYLRYWGSFSSIGLVFLPLGLAATIAQGVLGAVPPGKWIVELLGRSDEGRLAASLLLGSVPGIIETLLIGPAVVMAIRMIREGRPTDARTAMQFAWSRRRTLLRVWWGVHWRITLRAITIVGLPFAIRERVRWAFYQQAVMLDDAGSVRGSAGTSAAAVSGGWWRTAGEVFVYSTIGALPGPLVGVVMMVFLSSSIEFVYIVSSVLYAITVPYTWIGLTLFYLDRSGRTLPIHIPNVPGAFWREVRSRLPFGRRASAPEPTSM